MKRDSKIGLSVLLTLLCISFALFFYELLFSSGSAKTYEISVIASGKSDESLMLLKEGTEQAASELNANIRFIFLSKDQDYKEQIDLLKRESKNNVDAILIIPIDCKEVIEAIEEVNKNVPVTIIQSSLKTNSSIDRITTDEYLLGQQLVKTTLENIDDDKSIVIVNSSLENNVVEERIEGIVSELNGRKYYRHTLSSDEKNRDDINIKQMIIKEKVGAVICLDIKSSEYIGELKKNLSDDILQGLKVYGVGSTNKIISLLEEKIINGTATQNEFNIGYLAVQNAITNKISKKAKELKLKPSVVTSDNMYLGENERILFQFVK